ncbi:hypothetical protein MLD38_039791 [Melastoma candidum]|uniref:Uncharacterized protein n=1 Tax=Melastoma candidum TaxID=119954 RepID=A0ACB9L438_9MYRT|nr:hypothetical protein MLD38_039791 [Melastoma candidum]
MSSPHDKPTPSADAQPSPESHHPNPIPWRSQSQLRLYSSKLLDAIFRSRHSSPVPSSSRGGGRAFRGIADQALATAAKGRTRWSRAMLSSRVREPGKRRHLRPRHAPSRKVRRPPLTAVQRRVELLGRLVPGCRGISVTSLLEETTDYIAALEMQVEAMTALSRLLSAPAVRSSSPPSPLAPVNDGSDPAARC